MFFDADLGDEPPPAWAASIDQLRFRGSRVLEEIVLLHRASATLILTDLIENVEPARLPVIMRWIARMAGILDPDGKAPVDMRRTFLGRRREARAGVEHMLAWRPQRVILAHGCCYPDHAEAELRRAFRWTGLPTATPLVSFRRRSVRAQGLGGMAAQGHLGGIHFTGGLP